MVTMVSPTVSCDSVSPSTSKRSSHCDTTDQPTVAPSGGAASSCSVFKKPVGLPPPPSPRGAALLKRRRFGSGAPAFVKTVLDEDNYVAELEGIIERDFYPALPRLRAHAQYLDAERAGDFDTMQRLRQLYSTATGAGTAATPTPLAAHGAAAAGAARGGAGEADSVGTPASLGSPASGRRPGSALDCDTDAESVGDGDSTIGDTGAPCRPAVEPVGDSTSAPAMSLDTYMRCHTSEDNESFEQLMREDEQKRRAQRPWLYNTEEAHNSRQRALLSSQVPSIDEQAVRGMGGGSGGAVATWHYRARNDLMYVPNGVALTAAERVERAGQRGVVSDPADAAGDGPVDRVRVMHANTRLAGGALAQYETQCNRQRLASAAKQAQMRRLQGKIGVDGREVLAASPSDGELGRLVHTPSPMPGAGGVSPFMTWGEIDGTPFRLDVTPQHTPARHNGDAAGGATDSSSVGGGQATRAAPLGLGAAGGTPSFRMTAVPPRERLAHQLADQHAARHRDKKQRALLAASRQQQLRQQKAAARGDPERALQLLSPAARRLVTLGVQRGPGGSASSSPCMAAAGGIDSALRRSYTPSPASRADTPLMSPSLANTPTPLSSRVLSPTLSKSSALTASDTAAVTSSVQSGGDRRSTRKNSSSPGSHAHSKRAAAADFFN